MVIAKESDLNLVPNEEFANLASEDQIQRVAQALEENGIHTLIAENGEEAKRLFFELVPEGAEVFLGASVTLETLGIKDEIDKSGKYNALRPKMFAMDRATQGREILETRRCARLRGRQCPCSHRGWQRPDRIKDRQPVGAVCLRRRECDLGGRRAEDRQKSRRGPEAYPRILLST